MKRNSFVVAATSYGSMIASRFDYHVGENGKGEAGIGLSMMDGLVPQEVERCFEMLKSRHSNGDVIALDIGANIGTHTIPWARFMKGWGHIMAIEAQERIFYALAGNIAINNCFNARAIWAAVGSCSGIMDAPDIDYDRPGSFGSFSLKITDRELQPKSNGIIQVPTVAIDDLGLPKLDFLKIDVEGMEMDVLKGASETIKRCRPVILSESNFSVSEYADFMGKSYLCRDFDGGMNTLMEPR